jgi:hypothetical protein
MGFAEVGIRFGTMGIDRSRPSQIETRNPILKLFFKSISKQDASQRAHY